MNILVSFFCLFLTCTATPPVIVHVPTSSFTIESVPMGAMPASKPVKQSKVMGGAVGGLTVEQKLAQGKTSITAEESACLTNTGMYCQFKYAPNADKKIVVDVYENKQGKGYTVTEKYRTANVIEQIITNYGNETTRSKATTTICTDFISATSSNVLCSL